METSQKLINKVKEIQSIAQSILSQISVEDGQDIVAFIGPAKSGKSTLINCLLGNPLETKYDPGTEETAIVRKAGGFGPPIANPESSIPQQYSGKNWHMVDFPGFGNFTRAEQEIASAIAYTEVMRSQKSVRFVLVVPVGMIKSPNPMEFFKLLNSLCPNLSGSFCIVATKSDGIRIARYLNKAMKLPFSEANEVNADIINIAQLAIKSVLQLEHCIDFKEPVGKADTNFTPPNLQEIVDLINNLKGKKIKTETPVSISDHSKLQLVELNSAIESQLRNEIKNIYKYYDKQELLRNQNSRPSELVQIIDYLQKKSNYDSFIREIQKSDFNNLFLIGNLKAITYVQSIMKHFRIDGYWNSRDENEIFKSIRTAIRQIASQNINLIDETINYSSGPVKMRPAETTKEHSENDKKIKYTQNLKYSSQEEPSLEKIIKGTSEEIKLKQHNKNESHSEPMGYQSQTVPISIRNSPTSDDIKDKYSKFQPQSPIEIKLLISQMGPQGHFQEGRCANCVCEKCKPKTCNKNESHSEPIRNASMNNSPTSDDIKDMYSGIQPQPPIEVKLLISQISPQSHFQDRDSLEKRVNENQLNSEPIRNASHLQTSDDIKDNYLVIRNDNKPQSPIEIKLLISQMGSQILSQVGGSLEKHVNKNESSWEARRNAFQTSDDVIGNSSPFKNPLQVEETSRRPQNHGIMARPVDNYYNPDRFKTNHKENKPYSELIGEAYNPELNSQTSDDVTGNSSHGPYKNPLQVEETSRRPQNHGIIALPVENYYNPSQTHQKENKPNSEPIGKASIHGPNSHTSGHVKGKSSRTPFALQAGDDNTKWDKNGSTKGNKNSEGTSNKTSEHEKRKSNSNGMFRSFRGPSGRRKKANDDEMVVRIERGQGSRKNDECIIL